MKQRRRSLSLEKNQQVEATNAQYEAYNNPERDKGGTIGYEPAVGDTLFSGFGYDRVEDYPLSDLPANSENPMMLSGADRPAPEFGQSMAQMRNRALWANRVSGFAKNFLKDNKTDPNSIFGGGISEATDIPPAHHAFATRMGRADNWSSYAGDMGDYAGQSEMSFFDQRADFTALHASADAQNSLEGRYFWSDNNMFGILPLPVVSNQKQGQKVISTEFNNTRRKIGFFEKLITGAVSTAEKSR